MTQARAASRPEIVGEIPVYIPSGEFVPTGGAIGQLVNMIINPSTRRAYQLLRTETFNPTAGEDSGSSTLITAFDLDTRARLGSIRVSGLLRGSGPHVVDEKGGRIILADFSRPAVLRGIAIINEAAFAEGNTAAVTRLAVPPRPYVDLAGLRYEPRTGKIFASFNPARAASALQGTQGNAPVYFNFVVQWDPTVVADGALREDWMHALTRSCSTSTLPLSVEDSATPFLARDGSSVYAPCGFGDGGVQLLRLVIDPATGKPSVEEAVATVNAVDELMVDPEVERIHAGAGASSGAYVASYDGVAKRLMGTAVLSRSTSIGNVQMGIDLATGRQYFSVPRTTGANVLFPEPGGLISVDSRRTPLPQALAYRNVATETAYGLEVESGRGGPAKVYVLQERPDANGAVWKVISDPVPLSTDPPGANAEPTQDIEEVPGKTDSAYAGEASGYGLRWQSIGGVSRHAVLSFIGAGPCFAANRDILAGYVEKSSLSPVSVAAKAHSLAADLGTQADLRDLSRCRSQKLIDNGSGGGLGTPELPEQLRGEPGEDGWDVEPSECSGKAEDDSADESGSSKVACDEEAKTVKAESQYAGATHPVVSAGRGWSKTDSVRTVKDGLVVTTTSRVEGVRIVSGDQALSIASIESTAVSRSKGRVPKAGDPPRTEWTVALCGVHGPGVDERGCRRNEEAAQLISGLNTAFRGRVVFRQPGIDRELMQGTPKGYIAGVQRDRGEVSLAKIETGDDLLILPALEVQIRQADQPEVNRQIFQFAGVRSVAAYGVFKLPDEVGMPLQPSDLEVPDGASLVENVPLTGGSGSPGAPAPGKELGPLAKTFKRLAKTIAVGFGLLLRGPLESLALLGLWSTFGVPTYLYARRRRLAVLA